MKKILALLMAAGMLFSPKPGEKGDGMQEYLVRDELENMVLREDEENGVWEFSSDTLSVRVVRYREKPDEKHTLEYCVADVRASAASPLFSIAARADTTWYTRKTWSGTTLWFSRFRTIITDIASTGGTWAQNGRRALS